MIELAIVGAEELLRTFYWGFRPSALFHFIYSMAFFVLGTVPFFVVLVLKSASSHHECLKNSIKTTTFCALLYALFHTFVPYFAKIGLHGILLYSITIVMLFLPVLMYLFLSLKGKTKTLATKCITIKLCIEAFVCVALCGFLSAALAALFKMVEQWLFAYQQINGWFYVFHIVKLFVVALPLYGSGLFYKILQRRHATVCVAKNDRSEQKGETA